MKLPKRQPEPFGQSQLVVSDRYRKFIERRFTLPSLAVDGVFFSLGYIFSFADKMQRDHYIRHRKKTLPESHPLFAFLSLPGDAFTAASSEVAEELRLGAPLLGCVWTHELTIDLVFPLAVWAQQRPLVTELLKKAFLR
jgi:hypothetical protein